jgi:hypothetical protein
MTFPKTTWNNGGAPGISAEQLNRMEQGIADAHDQIEKDSTQQATLTHGQNVITTDQSSPLDVRIKGRTLVNHTGREGGFHSQGKWDANLTIDTSIYKFGTSSGKIDNSAGTGEKTSTNPQKMYLNGKYILFGVWVKSASGTPEIDVNLFGRDSSNSIVSSNFIRTTVTNQWEFIYKKVDLTANTDDHFITRLDINTFGTADDVVNFDGLIVYEIDSNTSNAIDVDPEYTGDKLVEKLPYVDSVKHVQNPVVKTAGKNLLPPFTEWTLHANATVISPYELELNATGDNQTSSVVIDVAKNTDYIFSSTHNGKVQIYGVTQNSFIKFFQVNQVIAFNSGSNNQIRVDLSNEILGAGTFTFANPQLELGSTATEFEPQNPSYLYGVTKLASNVGGSVKDEMYQRDGQWYRLNRWKKDVVLDGALGWAFHADAAGYKRVKIPLTPIAINGSKSGVVKNEGKIIQYDGNGTTIDSFTILAAGDYFYINISDTDSGWTDAMTPTVNMIKGYFNGWKYTGDGTTHSWVSIVDGSASPTQTESYVSSNIAPNFTPYELTYQLATAQEESVTVEGALNLIDGGNQVSVEEGVVVREVAKPVYYSDTGYYYLNTNSSALDASNFKWRTEKIKEIFKNGKKDTDNWIIEGASDAYGKERAKILKADFDSTATYSVTYIALDKYLLTVNTTEVVAEYNTNLHSVVSSVVKRQADIETHNTIQDWQFENVAVKGAGERIEKGVIRVDTVSSVSGTVTITFEKAFSETPIISAITEYSVYNAYCGSVTTTGFTLGIRHIDNVSMSSGGPVHWTAIGK